jgi:hypothetical protein
MMELIGTLGIIYVLWVIYGLIGIIVIANESSVDMDVASAWLILVTAPVTTTAALVAINIRIIKKWIRKRKEW